MKVKTRCKKRGELVRCCVPRLREELRFSKGPGRKQSHSLQGAAFWRCSCCTSREFQEIASVFKSHNFATDNLLVVGDSQRVFSCKATSLKFMKALHSWCLYQTILQIEPDFTYQQRSPWRSAHSRHQQAFVGSTHPVDGSFHLIQSLLAFHKFYTTW